MPGRAAVLAAVLVAILLPAVGGNAAPAAAAVAPACSVGDTLTTFRTTGYWYRSLLDTRYRLPSTYAPADLVPVGRAGVAGAGSMRAIGVADLAAMARAATAAGAPFAVQSAYRSYATQLSTFDYWVSVEGYAQAVLSSARAGHSEHQLGTALDLKTPGGVAPWVMRDWATTTAGAWLARNAWRYGFVLSYPKGKSPWATCYKYEPWHYRYFGRTIAAKIHASGLAPREWLWAHGATGTWTGGSPGAPLPMPTPTPRPTPTPTPRPTATPTPRPTPSATPRPTATPTPRPSVSASPLPMATVAPAPSASAPATAAPTAPPTPRPTATATAAPAAPTPVATPTPTPAPTATPGPSPSPAPFVQAAAAPARSLEPAASTRYPSSPSAAPTPTLASPSPV